MNTHIPTDYAPVPEDWHVEPQPARRWWWWLTRLLGRA